MRRARLSSLALFLLAGCGDGGAETCDGATCTSTATTSTMEPEAPTMATGSDTTATTGAEIPTCMGVEVPPGDVAFEDDGRTVIVPGEARALHVTVLDPAIVRVRAQEADEGPPRPSYAVVPRDWPAIDAVLGATADRVIVCTGELLVEVERATLRLRVTAADGTIVVDEPDGGGLFRDADTGARGVVRATPEDEHFYGFGERTGPLDKRGRTLEFWNTDVYQEAHKGYPPGTDPLYQSIPFFIGLRGATAYGLFLDNTHRLRFDMAASDPQTYRLTAAAGPVDQYVIAGPGVPDVVRRYTALTGRAPLPPRWALGYHQSRWGYAPGSAVLAIAAELRARDLPADAMWLDIQHMRGFRSFTWDPETFENPAKLVADLSAMHFRTVTIVDPGIKVDPAWNVYQEGEAGGHWVMRDGAPYVGEVWPGASVFPDFSRAATREWWQSLLPGDLAHGVAGLWIDMNEPANFVAGTGQTVPGDAVCDGDGAPTTMAEIHNVYASLEAEATVAGMLAHAPDERPFVLTRAGYAGIQRHAAVWTGDAPSTFPTLRETLPMLLGLGLSGVPFVGSDVGGYGGGATPELYARWIGLGAVSPFFRGHVMNTAPPQEPWQFGIEVTDIARAQIGRRYELLPYLYALFAAHAEDGAPLLRPLVHDFQADPAARTIDDQAMLGPWLMVAPLLTEGATGRDVYFPAGRWFERDSGAIVEGPATITLEELPLAAVPTYVREGAIVPWVDRAPSTDQISADRLYIDLYPGTAPSSFALYDDDGRSRAHTHGAYARARVTLARTADGARVTFAAREGAYAVPPRTLVLRVRRVDHGVEQVVRDGQPLPARDSYEALLAAGEGHWYDSRDLSLVVAIPDVAGGQALELRYDPTIVDPAPPVAVRLTVEVPAGTPADPQIHVATSASDWSHQPLTWDPAPLRATGEVLVPRGRYYYYKYTRGGWETVEKWPQCEEASDRYAFGAARLDRQDTVWTWSDQCP